MEKAKVRNNNSDKIFDVVNYIVLTIILLIVLYPLYFVLIASFSDPVSVNSGEVIFLPKKVTFEGYVRIFKDSSIITGFGNSILYTAIGVVINLVCTIPAAYSLSRKDMLGRNIIMYLIVFTMFFSGGLVPTFMVVKNLHLYNSMWALILPVAVVPWNLIIARTFFQNSIPDELREAAAIDGCTDFQFFGKMVLPLSSTLIAVMVLFYGAGHWNSYFNALIYINDKNLYPLQIVLRNILIVNQTSSEMMENVELANKQQTIAGLIQYGVIIISALPLLILYPFMQKYFVKGIMIGSIKG